MALGFSVHTGWAAMVAIARSGSTLSVLDRRRVGMLPISTSNRPEASPHVYHAARELPPEDARALLRLAEDEARSKAREALGAAIAHLHGTGHRVVGSAIITARQGPSRSLEEILQSHTLVHAAEGALFRAVIRAASEELGLPVIQVQAPELVRRAAVALGLRKDAVPAYLTQLGRPLGPPWTADHKAASLAAVLALG
ncbi:MAG TPA: hypothetical protein VGG91_05895 [Myxococcaceae bacterium]